MITNITTRRADGIGWVTLDGSDRLNAIGSSTYKALVDAVRSHERADNVGAVVIHGAGGAFCAGADIEEVQSLATREEFAAFLRGYADALDVIADSPLPIVAAIHGSALGGGLELALACDLRVVAIDSLLGFPEAKLGVLPGAGGTQRLPRIIPAGIAAEMIMTGRSITGERAYEIGLANTLTIADSLLRTAHDMATKMLMISPSVFGATKSVLGLTGGSLLAEGMELEREVVLRLFDTPAGREGFAKFGEERSPQKRNEQGDRNG